MSKEEVHNALKASREINTFSDSNLWREAFQLYNEQHGVKMRAKDMCVKCFNKVKEWIQQ